VYRAMPLVIRTSVTPPSKSLVSVVYCIPTASGSVLLSEVELAADATDVPFRNNLTVPLDLVTAT
jgi:hypothetical protein